MKIAVACDGKNVSGHFGHCEGFMIYEIRDDEVIKKDFIENPGHKPGFLPVFLKDLNIDAIIAGGMGARAQQLFAENDIDVIVGAEGDCDKVVSAYIKGELESTGSVCREHRHEGHCND